MGDELFAARILGMAQESEIKGAPAIYNFSRGAGVGQGRDRDPLAKANGGGLDLPPVGGIERPGGLRQLGLERTEKSKLGQKRLLFDAASDNAMKPASYPQ